MSLISAGLAGSSHSAAAEDGLWLKQSNALLETPRKRDLSDVHSAVPGEEVHDEQQNNLAPVCPMATSVSR